MRTASDIQRILEQDPLLLDEVKPSIKKWFLKWYPDNMDIINAFEGHSIYLKRNGKRDIYGAPAVWEHMRWNTLLTSRYDEFKLPANAISCTSRVIMRINDELEGMFRTHITNPKYLESLYQEEE